MVKFCVLKACPNRNVKLSHSVQAKKHGFPSNPGIKQKWNEFVSRHNRAVDFKCAATRRSSYICSLHFEKDLISPKGFLVQNAVPSIAPEYTRETAFKAGLIPSIRSDTFKFVNDFSLSALTYQQAVIDHMQNMDGAPGSSHCDDDLQPLTSIPEIEEKELMSGGGHVTEKENQPPDYDNSSACESSRQPENMKRRHCLEEIATDLPKRQCNEGASTSGATLDDDHSAAHSSENEFPTLEGVASTPQRKKCRAYIGDLSPSAFTPCSVGHSVQKVKESLGELPSRLKIIQQRLRRDLKKINNLESMLSHLEEERLMETETATLIEILLDVVDLLTSCDKSGKFFLPPKTAGAISALVSFMFNSVQ